MYIQIDGIFFENKGDELMLLAIVDHFNSHPESKEIKLVFGKGKSRPDPLALRRSGLFQLAQLQRFKIRWDKIFPDKSLWAYGLIKENKINAIIDSGGFQFGDQWIDRYTRRNLRSLKKYYGDYRKRGTKIIFLPQACGPFEHKISKDIIKTIHENSDLFFARDPVSYDHLTKTLGTQEKIKIAPDFTNLLQPQADENSIQALYGKVCIIPNSKMITHTHQNVSRNYINFLIGISDHILKNGHQIVYLNHEGRDDESLIKQLIQSSGEKCIFNPDLDARQIKRMINKATLLISSRYHGVSSGLNQGVPTFCTSWSHKYEGLMKDYGYPDHVLNVENIAGSWKKIRDVLDSVERGNWNPKKTLIENQKRRSGEMWDRVHELIFKKQDH